MIWISFQILPWKLFCEKEDLRDENDLDTLEEFNNKEYTVIPLSDF